MNFTLHKELLERFPRTSIGIVVASFDNTKKYPAVEQLKKHLPMLVAERGITKDHPNIQSWRETYKTFGVNPKDYRSSVEALVRRIVDNKGVWNISPAVDLYNSVSVLTVFPMGGYDFEKIAGRDIEVRFAREGESFIPLGKTTSVTLKPEHVVYAAGNDIICWLWNYKDAASTAIDEKTTKALFFIDSAELPTGVTLDEALAFFVHSLDAIGATVYQSTVANAQNARVALTLPDNNSADASELTYEELIAKLPRVAASAGQSKQAAKAPVVERSLSEEHEIRVGKVKALKELGIPAWPEFKKVDTTAAAVVAAGKARASSEEGTTRYAVAGRVMARREHGKTMFLVIQDRTATIQLYLKKDDLGEELFQFVHHFIDIGDYVWATGPEFTTKTGEVTLRVEKISLESKSLHPLADKFHGLTDVEQRYRHRYLDLMCNPETREKFRKRSQIVADIRSFLNDKEFMEVETPMLHPIPGGAAARPFITHHNAYNMDLYLRIAPELYLKKLVVGGIERVYEINRNFRNEGISTRHNPEFTMLEFYMAHGDYRDGMRLVEELLSHAATRVTGSDVVQYGDKQISFKAPFARYTVQESLIAIGGFTEAEISESSINETFKKHNYDLPYAGAGYGTKLFALFECAVEHKIVQPTFIIGYPIEVSPLAKRDPENPELAARFELFVAGMELSNGFTELNDPFDQAERFKGQAAARTAGDDEAHYFDADYIRALEYGLPPTVGAGIGIDRLVMLLTNTTSIKDVILFPTLKSV